MGDDLRLPERQCARTAMQWTTEGKGGFTTAEESKVPIISGGAYGYEHVNVAQQRRDPNSMLNWMERIIRMRKETSEIGWGDFEVLQTSSPSVLALRYDWRNNSVVVIHNLDANPREVRFDPTTPENRSQQFLINLLSTKHSRAEASGKHCIFMEPYGYEWYRLGSLNYVQNRTDA